MLSSIARRPWVLAAIYGVPRNQIGMPDPLERGWRREAKTRLCAHPVCSTMCSSRVEDAEKR